MRNGALISNPKGLGSPLADTRKMFCRVSYTWIFQGLPH